MGIDPDRLDGRIVGVASTWTGTMPCNLNQRVLADRVVEAVNAAGGVGMAFNTIAVSDNQSQGTPGMRASLISREAIADSIELMAHAHDFEAFVCLVGCDKRRRRVAGRAARAPAHAGGSAGPTRSPRRSSSSPRTLPRS
jgi:dihydroxy-acid dehydratase